MGVADSTDCEPTWPRRDLSHFGWAVQQAIEDDARIIVTSVSAFAGPGDVEAVANAVAKGLIVVAATSNPGGFGGDGSGDVLALNGVVAASAVDSSGDLQKDPVDGAAWAVPITTVVAAGVDMPTVGLESGWDQSGTATGSSFAAPIVAGMLAVVAQKYPDATGNQLLQSLVRNTGVSEHALARSDDGYGYGAAWLTSMLAADPSQYPDENPLMDKAAEPSAEQVTAAAARGFTLPEAGTSAGGYEDAPATPDAPDAAPVAPVATGMPIALVVVSIVLAVVVIGGLVTLVLVLTARRRKSPQGGTP
jgi:subtilisin family serine protease